LKRAGAPSSLEALVPHSLWVGRDCAKTIFGIQIKGEMNIEKGLVK